MLSEAKVWAVMAKRWQQVAASVLGGEQSTATQGRTAAARVIGEQLGGVFFVNHQTVVIVEFFTGFEFAQRANENTTARFVGFAVGRARVVDPTRVIAAVQGIDHIFFADMEVKRVVGVRRIVGVAFLRFFPTDNLAGVFNDDFAFGDRHQRKHALAMHA